MRRLISLILVLVLSVSLSLSLAVPSTAAKVGTAGSTGAVPVTISAVATTFSVTVPASIPLSVDANAVVTCADNLKIINNSAGPVEVTAISVQNNAWNIVSYSGGNRSSLASEKVNSNKLGLALKPSGGTQIATSATGNQNLTPIDGEWVIPASGNLPFECAGIATAVSTTVSSVQAAKVVFTLAWKAVDLISFTIDGTSYQAEDGMTWEEWISSPYNTDGFKRAGETNPDVQGTVKPRADSVVTADSGYSSGMVLYYYDTILAKFIPTLVGDTIISTRNYGRGDYFD